VLSCGRSRWLYLTTDWKAAQREAPQGDAAFLPRRESGDLMTEKFMTNEAMSWKPCLGNHVLENMSWKTCLGKHVLETMAWKPWLV
jgi:hypothetical protein